MPACGITTPAVFRQSSDVRVELADRWTVAVPVTDPDSLPDHRARPRDLDRLLDLLLLSVLTAGPAHGYAVIDLVNADSGGVFDLQQGTVYPILHRLEQESLIKSRWVARAGRQRREYEITSDGRDRLDAARADWKRFSRGVRGVIGEAT